VAPVALNLWRQQSAGSNPTRAARFGCRSTALRLASLAFTPFRASRTLRRQNNTKRIHLFPFPSRPAH